MKALYQWQEKIIEDEKKYSDAELLDAILVAEDGACSEQPSSIDSNRSDWEARYLGGKMIERVAELRAESDNWKKAALAYEKSSNEQFKLILDLRTELADLRTALKEAGEIYRQLQESPNTRASIKATYWLSTYAHLLEEPK